MNSSATPATYAGLVTLGCRQHRRRQWEYHPFQHGHDHWLRLGPDAGGLGQRHHRQRHRHGHVHADQASFGHVAAHRQEHLHRHDDGQQRHLGIRHAGIAVQQHGRKLGQFEDHRRLGRLPARASATPARWLFRLHGADHPLEQFYLGLSGNNSSGLEGGSTLGLDTTNATAGTFTYAGTIANPGGTIQIGLAKLGSGTLVLSGSNAYTGNTAVSAGMLVVNGALNTGGGTVNVNGLGGSLGGILAGTGTVGPVSVNGNGATRPRASAASAP